jgi:hypothetical protein
VDTAARSSGGDSVERRFSGIAMDFVLNLSEVLCGREQRDTVEAALQRS